MNQDIERQLERDVDRALKALPDLTAPPTLSGRVMAALRLRMLPWYRRAWTTWPAAGRFAFLAVLLTMFVGVCYAFWWLPQAPAVSETVQRTQGLAAQAGALLSAVGSVLDVGRLFVRNLGTGFLLGLGVAVGLAYATFLGLGTVYWRLAFARRD